MQVDLATVLSAFGLVTSLGTIVMAVLRGREMVAKAALEAVGSLDGRNIVMAITDEKHDRVAEKLASIDSKLDALTTSVNGMAIRLAVIEDQRGTRRE